MPEFKQVSLTELREANKVIDENQRKVDLDIEEQRLKEQQASLQAKKTEVDATVKAVKTKPAINVKKPTSDSED